MDDEARMLSVALATMVRAESRMTRRRAVGLRVQSTVTRWQSITARDESIRLVGDLRPRPPAG